VTLEPFRLEADRISLLDQSRLPREETWLDVRDAESMAEAITALRVRGAPAIGIAAALALAVEAARAGGTDEERMARLERSGRLLAAARPTAVNLSRAVERVLAVARATGGAPAAVRAEALAIWDEDRTASRAMASLGADLFATERRFLTHCHTGGLATGGGGTALGVLLELHRRRGGAIEVWATETRPLLQGSRLTMWELTRAGVSARLLVDSAAAHIVRTRGIEGVLVGADRIARNGDVANKIGTLSLALVARASGIPFVVVAPESTLDPATPDGSRIPIEQRDPAEVTMMKELEVAPLGAPAENPAFDVTPADLITAIVTERGARRGPTFDFAAG
jgi:methylthioribose-1-phosphate isomerase